MKIERPQRRACRIDGEMSRRLMSTKSMIDQTYDECTRKVDLDDHALMSCELQSQQGQEGGPG